MDTFRFLSSDHKALSRQSSIKQACFIAVVDVGRLVLLQQSRQDILEPPIGTLFV